MKQSKPKFTLEQKDSTEADAAISNGLYTLKGRFWLEGPSGTFLGYGRVILLERIKLYGSISEAARSMGMSYRHAWDLVDSINKQARMPLVETATGGKGGGGARLTDAGELAVQAFWRLYARFQQFLQEEAGRLEF
ncbi:MAG: LysR family transcriptional regulator [Deltaproteobacteria bacterium]|jgi:molybdate transport system regulatory protein|nr:LysR family transcriptional regulator [Deltaproteobacteria bacterium]